MPAIEQTCPKCHTCLVDQQCTVCKPSSSKNEAPIRRESDEFDDGDDLPRVSWIGHRDDYGSQGSLSPWNGHPSITERY